MKFDTSEILKNVDWRTKMVNLPTAMNKNLAYFIGVICGDGHIHKDYYRVEVGFGFDDTEYRLYILELVEKIFNKKPFVALLGRGVGVIVTSKLIYRFLTEIIGLQRGRKVNLSLPKVFNNDRKYLENFICGFFDTDGTIYLKRGRKSPYIRITQKSKYILIEIKEFLESKGMKCYIGMDKRTGIYDLSIYEKNSVFKFIQIIKSRHPKKLEIMNRFAPEPS